jgi:hypothetical protein
MENKLKYLEKYTSDKGSDKINKRKMLQVKIIDENEYYNEPFNSQSKNDQLQEFNKNKSDINNEAIIWQQLSEEDNEDELNALKFAKKDLRQEDLNISDDEIKNSQNEPTSLGNKRQRHDSDCEEDKSDSEKSERDKELNELIQDEDGDLLLDSSDEKNNPLKNPNKGGLILEFKSNNSKKIKKDERLLFQQKEQLKKQTVYRDEKGRIIDKSQTKEAQKKELQKVNYENLEKWAKGIIQKEEINQKREEIKLAKEEPFARYDIDKSTEEDYRKKFRFGDPMKGLLSIHKYESGIILDSGDRSGSRGFFLPKCKFTAPVNRFGITPGYRWDGVDRGTGFERKYLESINSRRAREEEYHKIRTEDM